MEPRVSGRSLDGTMGGVDEGSYFEMKDLGATVPSWQVLSMGDGRMICMKDTCPEKITKTH